MRPEPLLTDESAAFWTGGEHGELRLTRCTACKTWMHPPRPVCPQCGGVDLRPEATSGKGTVWSFTVNRYQWTPALDPPYVLAEVELDDQPGLRLLTAIVGTDDVKIGLPVQVRFERSGDAWIPVFAP